MARERERRDDDDDGDDRRGSRGDRGGADQKSAMPYVLGFLFLGIVAAGIAYAVNRSKGSPPAPGQRPGKGGTTAPAPEDRGPLGAAPDSGPAAGAPKLPPPAAEAPPEPPKPAGGIKTAVRGGVTDKKDEYKLAENPPSGGNYGRPQAVLLTMLKENRFSVVMDLGHLPDTPPDVVQKIDAEIPKFGDPNAGSEFLRARDRLRNVGRAAIPRVLGVAARLDFSKFARITDAAELCQVADAIDEVMRGITGYDKFLQLQYSPNSKLEDYSHVIDEWFIWWYTIGYKRATFYKADGAAEDEKL
jgi:hypothetical protein